MKILLGIYSPDSGEIFYKGNRIRITSARMALSIGISMIHQEIHLNPYQSVAENIWLGREQKYRGTFFLDWSKMFRESQELLDDLQLNLDPKEKVGHLSVSSRQMVEIARAISYNSDVIIMDEPTSALSTQEVQKLFALMSSLKSKGISIIYISHRLDEIFQIADRITLLRDGKYIGTYRSTEISKDEVISLMVGRRISNLFPKEKVNIGDPVLEVRNLCRKGVFRHISFSLRRSEILGIAGLMGSGRTELMRSIIGADPLDEGEIFLEGRVVHIENPRQAIQLGIGMIPEDRRKAGLITCRSVLENMSIASLDQFKTMGLLHKKRTERSCIKYARMLSIKFNNLYELVSLLSGGNQQKVVISKWLMTSPKILIMDEPTRGIDVGAKMEIHRIMSSLVKEGMSIILISSEMPEIIGMSDRIIVMSRGEKVEELDPASTNQEDIMRHFVAEKRNGT